MVLSQEPPQRRALRSAAQAQSQMQSQMQSQRSAAQRRAAQRSALRFRIAQAERGRPGLLTSGAPFRSNSESETEV